MSKNKDFLFDNVHIVAAYLCSLKSNISPLKLHKSLYFLFAYYGATYGQKDSLGEYEGSALSFKYLFPVEFEAWKSGPVIREIFQKENMYDKKMQNDSIEIINKFPEVKIFIDELFEEIDLCSDFKLLNRSKQDNCVESKDIQEILNNDEIIAEYKTRYLYESPIK